MKSKRKPALTPVSGPTRIGIELIQPFENHKIGDVLYPRSAGLRVALIRLGKARLIVAA